MSLTRIFKNIGTKHYVVRCENPKYNNGISYEIELIPNNTKPYWKLLKSNSNLNEFPFVELNRNDKNLEFWWVVTNLDETLYFIKKTFPALNISRFDDILSEHILEDEFYKSNSEISHIYAATKKEEVPVHIFHNNSDKKFYEVIVGNVEGLFVPRVQFLLEDNGEVKILFYDGVPGIRSGIEVDYAPDFTLITEEDEEYRRIVLSLLSSLWEYHEKYPHDLRTVSFMSLLTDLVNIDINQSKGFYPTAEVTGEKLEIYLKQRLTQDPDLKISVIIALNPFTAILNTEKVPDDSRWIGYACGSKEQADMIIRYLKKELPKIEILADKNGGIVGPCMVMAATWKD